MRILEIITKVITCFSSVMITQFIPSIGELVSWEQDLNTCNGIPNIYHYGLHLKHNLKNGWDHFQYSSGCAMLLDASPIYLSSFFLDTTMFLQILNIWILGILSLQLSSSIVHQDWDDFKVEELELNFKNLIVINNR